MKVRNTKQIRFFFFFILAILLVGIAIFAPYMIPHDPFQRNAMAIRSEPNLSYLFGTDNYGRCVFSRVLMGTRTSIGGSLFLVLITATFGTFLGVLCGYYGRGLDFVVGRVIDIFLSIPQMVLAIAVAGLLGGGMMNAMLALGFSSWIIYARLARSLTRSLKNEDYISAARMGGSSDLDIICKEIIPCILGTILVNATIQISVLLIGLAGLSFLGLGVQVPDAEWGSMISEARAYMQLAPWAVIAPSCAIIVTSTVFNCLGDAARDLLEAS